MVVKKGLPEDVSIVLKQLVMNGHFSMTGRVLSTYCRRTYGVDEETAARWTVAYFPTRIPSTTATLPKTTGEGVTCG